MPGVQPRARKAAPHRLLLTLSWFKGLARSASPGPQPLRDDADGGGETVGKAAGLYRVPVTVLRL